MNGIRSKGGEGKGQTTEKEEGKGLTLEEREGGTTNRKNDSHQKVQNYSLKSIYINFN